MIDDCNINNLAKNQVSAVFNSRAIRRSVSSKFIEICMERHVGAHPDGHQHGVSIQISINLGETLLRIARELKTAET